LIVVPFVDSSSVRSRPSRGLLDSLLGIALSPLEEVDVPSSGDWFTFSPLSAESLPPEQRALAEQAIECEPLAEIHIRILGWEPGQSEVRFSGGWSGDVENPEWHDRLFDRAIEDIRDARRIFGSA